MSFSARMDPRRFAVVACAVVLLAATSAHALVPRAIARAFLDQRVPLNAVALVVQDVDAPRPLLAHQPGKAMSPASTMKLVTTFAALDTLGADYRWRTEAYARGRIDAGVLRGDLVLKGYGDPKITIEQWQLLMHSLREAGIDRIEGDLVLDRSRFELPPHDPAAFDNAPLRPYNVGPDALLVNFKSVRFTFAPDAAGAVQVAAEPDLPAVHLLSRPQPAQGPCLDWRRSMNAAIDDRGGVADVSFPGSYAVSCGEREWYMALLDPLAYAHAMFTTYFREAGGAFAGGYREGKAPKGATPIATLRSPPLYDIARDVNKLSNNVMARQLFLTLASTATNKPASPQRAAAAVRRWLASRRLSMPELVIENGSGLSRTDRISAGSLARLLLAADKSRVRDEFESSLAVAATDGTVERRFQQAKVGGQALLKTGSLEGVRALAGYVLTRDGHRVVVVAIVNHANAAAAQPALDFLVEWVYSRANAR